MKIRYKVLRANRCSPYQHHAFELGRWYREPRIGQPGDRGCQRGLYAGPVESLLYRGVYREDEAVYRCEVRGKQAGEPPLKTCWEELRVIERLTSKQVKALARQQHSGLGYLLEECLYPIDPLQIKRGEPTAAEIELLRAWILVWGSVGRAIGELVGQSVGQSVWESVWESVRDSVWWSVWWSVWESLGQSVWGSIRQSVWTYIGSLFPNVEQWRYIEHEPGCYPFQAGADLWRAGLIPSRAGKVWRLHSGPDATVVWEGTP